MEKFNLGFQLIIKAKPRQAQFVLGVINQDCQDRAFEFSTGQEFDFVVLREGQEVWHWSGDMMFIQAFHTLVLKKGQSITYKASWDYRTLMDERARPGDYLLRACFWGVSRQEPVAAREFVVP